MGECKKQEEKKKKTKKTDFKECVADKTQGTCGKCR